MVNDKNAALALKGLKKLNTSAVVHQHFVLQYLYFVLINIMLTYLFLVHDCGDIHSLQNTLKYRQKSMKYYKRVTVMTSQQGQKPT
jgi:hypothetical protein